MRPNGRRSASAAIQTIRHGEQWDCRRIDTAPVALLIIQTPRSPDGPVARAGEQPRLQVVGEGGRGEDITDECEVVGDTEQGFQFLTLALRKRRALACGGVR
jgi:hypothetical protein